MATATGGGTTRRGVLVTFAVDCGETIGLAIAAWVTSSVALRAQTAAAAADVGVQVFLLIGVLRSVRAPDETHPLGYGREGFYWSLLAAVGIFVGGGVLGLDQAIHAALHPSPVHPDPLAYLVLALTVALDAFALEVALRPERRRAAERGVSLRSYLYRSTDPASTTNVVGGGCAVIGGMAAIPGLAVTQVTGSPAPDAVAGALIGLLLLAASVLLLQTNRDLLSGRGLAPSIIRQMSQVIGEQDGVVTVPDLFAVVIGPSSLIVDGDVVFAADLDVQSLEKTITRCVAALRTRWPAIEYVYLTPVSKARPRRVARSESRAVDRDNAAHPPDPGRK